MSEIVIVRTTPSMSQSEIDELELRLFRGHGAGFATLYGCAHLSNEEARATIECMKRHDDENTQDIASGITALLILDGYNSAMREHRPTAKTSTFFPDARCVQNQVRRMRTMRSV